MSVLRDISDFDESELSDTWLELLGTDATESDASRDRRDREDREDRRDEGDGNDMDKNVGSATIAISDGRESLIPVTADPWSELLCAQGVEVVDLQQNGSHMIHIARVSFSEQEVEQALQLLQEQ